MSIRQTLKVELEDGTEHEVTFDGRDLRAWEAWREQPVFTGGTSLTRLTEYAYLAGRRTGLWNGTYESWEPSCVGVEFIAGEEANPTLQGRGDESSSALRSEPRSVSASGKKQAKKQS